MSTFENKNRIIHRLRSKNVISASALMLGLLTACSSVPDAVNPVEWYNSAADLVTGDDTPSAEDKNTPVPGENEDFPNLASVPERPSVQSGDAVADGLIADPNAPQYANAISRQSADDENGLQAQSNTAPPPPALPVTPVTISSAAPLEPEITASSNAVPQQPVLEQNTTMVSKPLVIEPGRLPSGETYEEYRSRLMAGLSTGMPTVPPILTSQGGKIGSADQETVIISSIGVQNGTDMYPDNGQTTLVNQSGFMQVGGPNSQPLLIPGSTKIATVHFNNGSANLDIQDRQVLKQVVALHQKNGGVLRVIGHASSRTNNMEPVQHKMVNYSVSVSRANSIARELVRLGAEKSKVLIGAVSDTDPLYYEVMPTGEAGNRRAEIYIDS